MPLHALPCSLFTVNLLQLRSHTHACTLHALSALSCTTRSLSLFLLQQQRSLQGPSQAHILFFLFSFPYLTLLFCCCCVSLLLTLSLACLLHRQRIAVAATAMQLVGADAGCAVVVTACIVFVCAQIKRNTKIKTKENETIGAAVLN